ncbi:MAG: hypothetical protein L0Y76_05160 [Ignavibacteria bacterium]|nr:hypothetical protein [Ignavibacteria bacterium]
MLKLFLVKVCIILAFPVLIVTAQDNPIQHSFPFKLVYNKVVVPVNIGESRSLNLILDSGFGFDGIILFKKELTDSVNLVKRIQAQLPGAGDGPPTPVIMSESMSFSSGTCEFNNQRIIILQGSKFENSPTDGVIGYSYFGHYKVEVNYDTKTITLHDPAHTFDETGWETIPLTFNRNNWPFLNIKLAVDNEEPVQLYVYIDYASSLAVELSVTPQIKVKVPENFEGEFNGFGLSGDVKGKTARASRVLIGKYELSNVTVTFFEGNSRSKDKSSDGTVSNDLLRRFNLLFDYANSRLLIKPNNSFNEPFEFIR